MKKLLLLCFVFLLSGNFYAQETAAQKKKAAQQTKKRAKSHANMISNKLCGFSFFIALNKKDFRIFRV